MKDVNVRIDTSNGMLVLTRSEVESAAYDRSKKLLVLHMKSGQKHSIQETPIENAESVISTIWPKEEREHKETT